MALLEVKRPILEKQAKERQKGHGGTAPGKPAENTPAKFSGSVKGEVREALAKEAGVSKMTYDALRKVNATGSDELKQAVSRQRGDGMRPASKAIVAGGEAHTSESR